MWWTWLGKISSHRPSNQEHWSPNPAVHLTYRDLGPFPAPLSPWIFHLRVLNCITIYFGYFPAAAFWGARYWCQCLEDSWMPCLAWLSPGPVPLGPTCFSHYQGSPWAGTISYPAVRDIGEWASWIIYTPRKNSGVLNAVCGGYKHKFRGLWQNKNEACCQILGFQSKP